MSDPARPFWKSKSLQALNEDEWESLCDGCARCCMIKLEDEDTGQLFHTRIACRLLDTDSCRCLDYAGRLEQVSDCQQIRRLSVSQYDWLPASCAYRRIAEGRGLAEWHPLVSGSSDSVLATGVSMRGRCISEQFVHPSALSDNVEDHCIEFDDP